MGDHKYFIVIIIFYISKNNNYKLLCKSDLTVTYCFGCSTCNSWLFFFKIVANEAYLQGLHRSGSNRAKLVQTGSVSSVFFGFLFHGMVKLQLKVWFFPVLWTGLLIPNWPKIFEERCRINFRNTSSLFPCSPRWPFSPLFYCFATSFEHSSSPFIQKTPTAHVLANIEWWC